MLVHNTGDRKKKLESVARYEKRFGAAGFRKEKTWLDSAKDHFLKIRATFNMS